MPPRRAASFAQAWQPSNYVCLSCRHQLFVRPLPQYCARSSFFTLSIRSHDDATNDTRVPRAIAAIPSSAGLSVSGGNGTVRPKLVARGRGAIGAQGARTITGTRIAKQNAVGEGIAVNNSHQMPPGTDSKDDASVSPRLRYFFMDSTSPPKSSPSATEGGTVVGMSIASAMKHHDRTKPTVSGPGKVRSVRTQSALNSAGKKRIAKGSGKSKPPRVRKTRAVPDEHKDITDPQLSKEGHEKSRMQPEVVEASDVPSETKETTSAIRVRLKVRRRLEYAVRKSTSAAATVRKAESDPPPSKVRDGNALDKSASTTPSPVEHKPLWQVMASLVGAVNEDATTPPAAKDESRPAHQEDLPAVSPDSPKVVFQESFTVKPSNLEITPLNIPQPAVPGLEYGLDRVLFNPGIYQLQDPLSRVYNFDPYLQKIMPVKEFDFNALKEYKTSSQDTVLSTLAQSHGKKYIGSTSSMTGTLAHFHYLLSAWRPVNLSMLSRGFSDKLDTFTSINRAPNAIFLRWKDGTYAIDADKQYDSGNVLMLLGKSMEKLLTMPTEDYERYRKSDPRAVSEEERISPEAYEFTTMGDFLMRSQLDAHDPRLPGTGMFDLKTRAVVSVRMDARDFEPMTGYEIYSLHGRFGSYEREYYDMIRSTMLKYMLQVRMGRMDGIFVAYHNVERIFGFQYISLQELDRALHGQMDLCLGDQEFKMSLELLNKVLDKATAKFPQRSLRFHFETTPEAAGETPGLWIFAEPMEDEEIDRIQATSKAKIEDFERTMLGFDKEEAASHSTEDDSGGGSDKQAQETEVPSSGSPARQDGSQYVSSESDADPEFIESIISTSSQAHRPLFAASLVCRSRINGIPQYRPSTLKPTEEWEVEYLLREWDSPAAMWARYEQMKHTRKEIFEKFDAEEDTDDVSGRTGEVTGKQKRDRQFVDFLRGMSEQGREFRGKMDEMEAGKPHVVVGQPHARQSAVSGPAADKTDESTPLSFSTSKR